MNKTRPLHVLIDDPEISVGDSAYNGLNRARCRKLKKLIGKPMMPESRMMEPIKFQKHH